jgi:hypothetical protein
MLPLCSSGERNGIGKSGREQQGALSGHCRECNCGRIQRGRPRSRPNPSEDSATIRAPLPAQIEWLDTIEAALSELRRRNIADPNLAEAATIVSRLRAAISSRPEHITADKALWLCLFGCISEPFLKHFSSAIGDDLGHATAHRIIEVLSSLSQYLKI